jgi:glycosyltransferase involved in cell wall biosynthesis
MPSNRTTIDVIIPTWNEEFWLPRLLTSLSGSRYIRHIIVADNYSEDNTASLALTFGCELVRGGRPATGRNAGAAISSADILLFVDADTILPNDYPEYLNWLFQNSSLVGAYFRNIPLSDNLLIIFLYRIMDTYISAMRMLNITQGIGTSVAVRTSAFIAAGGFPEDVAVGEDAYFLSRLSKIGEVRYIREHPVYTSSRRLLQDGVVKYVIKMIIWVVLRLLNLKESIIPYNWRQYKKELALREEEFISAIDFLPGPR